MNGKGKGYDQRYLDISDGADGNGHPLWKVMEKHAQNKINGRSLQIASVLLDAKPGVDVGNESIHGIHDQRTRNHPSGTHHDR